MKSFSRIHDARGPSFSKSDRLLARLVLFVVLIGTGDVQGSPIRGSVFFEEAVISTTMLNVGSVGVADLNGDGYADVVSMSRPFSTEPGKIAWFLNDQSGAFASQQFIVSTTGSESPNSPVPGDLNNDGRIDLAYWISGNGVDSQGRIVWTPNTGGSPANDNASRFGYNAGVPASNQSLIAITPVVSISGSPNYPTTLLAAANINGDAWSDIASGTQATSNLVAWIPNNAGNPSGSLIPINSVNHWSPTSLRAADLDRDGFTDLLLTSANASMRNMVSWFKGTGTGMGTAAKSISTAQDGFRDSAIADLNGDGWPDVVCSAFFSSVNRVTWFQNSGNPGQANLFGSAQLIANVTAPTSIAVADLNFDGRPDIVGASASPGTRVFWCENGGGLWSLSGTVERPDISIGSVDPKNPISVAVADFNHDGAPDVVAAWIVGGSFSNFSSKVAAYLHVGGQTALATTNTAPGALTEWRIDDVLRIVASNSGYGTDNNAQLSSVALDLETSAGVPMNTTQANLLLDRIDVYADTNGSNAFEVSADTLVGRVDDLALSGGLLTVPIVPTNPTDAQIAARATQSDPRLSRTFFVVARAGGAGSAQVPNTFRITHRSKGTARTALKDATIGAALTVELLGNTLVSSSLVTVQPAPVPHTYTDYSYLYFADTATPGAAAADDFDGDGSKNLTEFGFGIDPTVGPASAMVVTGGILTQRGLPTISVTNIGSLVDFKVLYCRRKDSLSGLSYKVQFSANLIAWEDSTATPTVIADDGEIQAVSVPYPFFLSDFQKARFFRVAVTSQ